MANDELKLTVDEIIAAIKEKAKGRTRYEGQAPYWDEILVAEIERLRKINRKTLADEWRLGFDAGARAMKITVNRLIEEAERGK